MGQTSETVEEHGVAKGTLISNQGKYVSNTFILAIISISTNIYGIFHPG
jgi:hypothetical protein